jgi:signal transduction histidine kinase
MILHRISRLFTSVFTKLLVIILATGAAMTLTVIAGFTFVRFHSITHLDRNLALYADYLKRDLGDPPDFQRAADIAGRTGMAIRFDHPGGGWQTAGFPEQLPLERAWTRQRGSDIWTGHIRGHVFIRTAHAGGSLLFITSRRAVDHENAGIVFLAMAAVLASVLAVAYFFLRRIMNPLRPLREGVEALGAGRLDHRIPASGRDEFRDLGDAFNQMAARLSGLMSSKEQLLVDVSHELRTPLTRLKVQLAMVPDPETRLSLNADVAEMESMVTAILEEARLRSTAAELQRKSVDMADLLKSVVEEFQNRPPGVVCGPMRLATVLLDGEKMRTVLRNLIDNAVKHTPADGPPVEVSLVPDEARVAIVVEDRGMGIAAEALPRLFEPFYRADASRSRKTGGFGLGLSICKAIIDAHHGRIHIDSKPGKGTRVTITLAPMASLSRS